MHTASSAKAPAAWALRGAARVPRQAQRARARDGRERDRQGSSSRRRSTSSLRARRRNIVARKRGHLPVGPHRTPSSSAIFAKLSERRHAPSDRASSGRPTARRSSSTKIGELPNELQAHLLRLLGRRASTSGSAESKRRVADIPSRRRDETGTPTSFKEDLRRAPRASPASARPRRATRGTSRSLARHLLLRNRRARSAHRRNRSSTRGTARPASPRLTRELRAGALVLHSWTTHVRELEGVLPPGGVDEQGQGARSEPTRCRSS